MRITLPSLLVLGALCSACSVFSPPTPVVQTVVFIVTATPAPGQSVPLFPAVKTRTPTAAPRSPTPSDTPPSPPTVVTVLPTGGAAPSSAPPASLSCSGRIEDAAKIGLHVASFMGGNDNAELVIDGKPYEVPAMASICIDLAPGRFAWSATHRGLTKGDGTVEVNSGIAAPILNLCAPEGQITDRCGSSGTVTAPSPASTPTQPCCAMLVPPPPGLRKAQPAFDSMESWVSRARRTVG